MTTTTTARVPRAERSEQVRAAVLAAARDLFLEHGYHGASLDQIAAAAGFTKGAVYSRFASKGDLFLALLEERIAARAQQNQRLLDEIGDAGFAELLRRVNAVERRDIAWQRLVLEFRIHAARDPELNGAYAALHAQTVDRLAATFEATGAAAGREARSLAQAVLMMASGAVLEQAVDPTAMDEDLVIDLVIRLQGGSR